MAGDGRCLKTDVPAADDQHAASRQHGFGEKIGVALVTHDVDPVEVSPDRRGELTRRRSGRQQQGPVVEGGAVL